jgi:transcriptional regulator with XRE-family HTH domain
MAVPTPAFDRESISVNRRIKEVRHALKLSQVQFSRILSLSSGYLAGIETGKRKVNKRLVKLICGSFKANERWIETGEGEMFPIHQDTNFTALVNLFNELDPRYQAYLLKNIGCLLEIQNSEFSK